MPGTRPWEDEADFEVLAFQAGTIEKFAIPVEFVIHADEIMDLARAPGSPPHVAGIASFRGKSMAAARMDIILGLDSPGPFSKALICGTLGDPVCILASSVDRIIRIGKSGIRPAPAGCREEIGALALLPGERLMSILDFSKLRAALLS